MIEINNLEFFSVTKDYRVLRLLDTISKSKNMTQESLGERIGVSKGMINRYIKELRNNNILCQGVLELTDEGMTRLLDLRSKYYDEITKLNLIFSNELNLMNNENKKEIKIAAIKSLGTMLPFLAKELGILNKYPIDFHINYFDNGQGLMEKFMCDDYHLGLLGVVPAFLWKSSGASIELKAHINKGGHCIVGKNIDNILDLNNRLIMVPQINDSVSDNLLKKLCKEYNIGVNKVSLKDYHNNLDSLITNDNYLRDIDAIILWEPYISHILKNNSNFKVVYDFTKNREEYLSNVLIANNELADENQMLLIKNALLETVDTINKDKNLVAEKLEKFFHMDKETLVHGLEKVNYIYKEIQ